MLAPALAHRRRRSCRSSKRCRSRLTRARRELLTLLGTRPTMCRHSSPKSRRSAQGRSGARSRPASRQPISSLERITSSPARTSQRSPLLPVPAPRSRLTGGPARPSPVVPAPDLHPTIEDETGAAELLLVQPPRPGLAGEDCAEGTSGGVAGVGRHQRPQGQPHRADDDLLRHDREPRARHRQLDEVARRLARLRRGRRNREGRRRLRAKRSTTRSTTPHAVLAISSRRSSTRSIGALVSVAGSAGADQWCCDDSSGRSSGACSANIRQAVSWAWNDVSGNCSPKESVTTTLRMSTRAPTGTRIGCTIQSLPYVEVKATSSCRARSAGEASMLP